MAGHAPEITVPKAPKARVAIISSSWHLDICNDLIAGATRALEAAEVKKIKVIYVPGSFEIPLAAQKIFEKNFRKMLDGVLPNRLDELFIKQNEMRKLAESMEDKSLYPEMYSGNQDPKYFTDAQLAAKEDAKLFVETGDVASATGWYNYLTGKGVYSDV